MRTVRYLLLMALLGSFDCHMTCAANENQSGEVITVEPDGRVMFAPPFPMTHYDNSGDAGLPITSVTYSAENAEGTHGASRVTFTGTFALWFAEKPSAVTNSVTTIGELKTLIDTNRGGKPGWATNLVEKIITFQGQDAIEFSGNVDGLWREQIVLYWQKSEEWMRNTVLVIDAEAPTKEICKTLIRAVVVDPPKADYSESRHQNRQKVEMSGVCAVTNSDHVATLIVQGYEADFFAFRIVGKEKGAKINSIQGTYQYETNSAHPLVLTFLGQQAATFRPSTNDLLAIIPPHQNHVARRIMKDGHYKLQFEYTLNSSGQTNSCSFDVRFATKTF